MTTPTPSALIPSLPRSPPTASPSWHAALHNYANNLPSGYTLNAGESHFIYHQQEMGAFIQDQWKINDRFSLTPGLRYDWQNFLANDRLSFSPRVSFAWVLDPDAKIVLRGGGGIYYDRFGIRTATRSHALRKRPSTRRQALLRSSHRTTLHAHCRVLRSRVTAPVSLAQLAPGAKLPYQIQYGLSIERQLGERATGVVSVYSARGIDEFRSVDINAPTSESGYTMRPNTAYGMIRQMQPAGFFEGKRRRRFLPRPAQQILHRLRPLHLVPL